MGVAYSEKTSVKRARHSVYYQQNLMGYAFYRRASGGAIANLTKPDERSVCCQYWSPEKSFANTQLSEPTHCRGISDSFYEAQCLSVPFMNYPPMCSYMPPQFAHHMYQFPQPAAMPVQFAPATMISTHFINSCNNCCHSPL